MTDLTLITGATGFIGRHVARQYIREGARVRVLCRQPDLLECGTAAHAEIVRGDVRDPVTLRRATAGVRTVIHLAACARAWSRDPGEFTAVNRDAVAALLDAAANAGVERLVHVSTVLTLCLGDSAARRPTAYEATKLDGERLAESAGFAVVVHPTRVYGPGPLNDANGVTRLVEAYLAGRFRVRLADGDVLANYVHVEDVAAGIRSAAARGETPGHYVLGGENASMRELLAVVSRVGGVSRRVFAIPPRVGIALGGAAELLGRVGGRPPITRDWVRLFLDDQRVDIQPTRRALGYDPRSLDRGIAETVAWLRREERRVA
jgi:nucleoside-diphosphate-sugar epimerase